MQGLRLYLCLVPLVIVSVCGNAIAEIEAVKGKRYRLSRQHGPYMVLVSSIRDVPKSRRVEGGMTMWEAADQLVYELRLKGIPAYVHNFDEERDQIESVDRVNGGIKPRSYITQHEGVVVLAGNFSATSDPNAKLVRDYIKDRFDPPFLRETKNGGLFAVTPGRPRPLSRAFVVPNPLLSEAEVARATFDPLIEQLNSDMEYSLLKNPSRYTLVVATFQGNSITQVGARSSQSAMKHFEKNFGESLDEAAINAWQLTQALRQAKEAGYSQNYEAWILHERFKSVVTIGSFDSPTDPRIAQIARQFRGKMVVHPETGEQVQSAEVFTIPSRVPAGQKPDASWFFDPVPKLIEIPGFAQR